MYSVSNGTVTFFSENADQLRLIVPEKNPDLSNVAVFDENLPLANKTKHYELVINSTKNSVLQFYAADYSSLVFALRKALRDPSAKSCIDSTLTSIVLSEFEIMGLLEQLEKRKDIAEHESEWHETNKVTITEYFRRAYSILNPWFMTAQGIRHADVTA